MIRTRGLLAVSGLLLALAMLSACGSGSSGKSKTATPKTTGTAPATTGTPATGSTPGATGQPSVGTPATATRAPTSTFPPPVTPPSAFDERASERAIEFLRDLNGDLRDLSGERSSLERSIPGRSSEPTPTLIRPGSGTWFEECCASDLHSFQHALDVTERDRLRVATIYSDTGHTRGAAMMDQFAAQLNAIRDTLQAVAAAETPQDGLDQLDAVSPILAAMGNTVSAALSCCSAPSSTTPGG
jgi:hypothetical protein